MKRFLSGCVGVGCLMLMFCGLAAVGQKVSAKAPVVVELFTSEGCSSCPPADALLMKLDQEQPVAGVEVIALEEHVDYWEGQGWHDRFSSHQYTDRQNVYGRRFNLNDVFTPQMVVDGTEQFVGNDVGKARQAIEHAAQSAKVGLTLGEVATDGHRVNGVVSGVGELGKGDLFAALVDPSATTQVKGGENKGQVLHHAGVVRSLVRIGSLQDLAKGPVKFALTAPADAAANERVVVFAQRGGQGVIVGAAVGMVGGMQKTVAVR